MPSSSEVFARTVLALQPYTPDVVFIGGWVHALYLAEANATGQAIRTEDIDVTIPHRLLTRNRTAASAVGRDPNVNSGRLIPPEVDRQCLQLRRR